MRQRVNIIETGKWFLPGSTLFLSGIFIGYLLKVFRKTITKFYSVGLSQFPQNKLSKIHSRIFPRSMNISLNKFGEGIKYQGYFQIALELPWFMTKTFGVQNCGWRKSYFFLLACCSSDKKLLILLHEEVAYNVRVLMREISSDTFRRLQFFFNLFSASVWSLKSLECCIISTQFEWRH